MRKMRIISLILGFAISVYLLGGNLSMAQSDSLPAPSGEDRTEAAETAFSWTEILADSSLSYGDGNREKWDQAVAAQGDVAPETLTPYDAEEFSFWLLGFWEPCYRYWGETGTFDEFSSVCYEPWGFDRGYPIECIRRLDDSHLYVVYRLTSGENDLYFYAVFEDGFAGSNLSDDKVFWQFRGEFYYGAEELSMEDCANLQVGDTATEAEALLHCVGDEALRPRRESAFSVYCLLKDGVLIIDFGLDEESGDASETWVETWASGDKTAMLELYRIRQINLYRYGEKKENLSEIHRNDRLAMCGFTD